MVGGTIRRKLIHRESFKASALHHSDNHAVEKHCRERLCLDNAFALIDGHPSYFCASNFRRRDIVKFSQPPAHL